MDLEIVYSYKEYQVKYPDFLISFCSEYEESEPIDFINIEIEKYKIVSRIINFPAEVAFSPFFMLSPSIDLKVFSVSQEMYDFIFAIENTHYYYKIYKDIIDSTEYVSSQDIERKVIQIRMIFPKIISFLELKKTEILKSGIITNSGSDFIKQPLVPKKIKIRERWHALIYWFELIAHGKKPPVDNYGNFIKSEIEKTGAKKCRSTGQSFYKHFKDIDINNVILLQSNFGSDWKETVLKMIENDQVTTDFINEKYK